MADASMFDVSLATGSFVNAFVVSMPAAISWPTEGVTATVLDRAFLGYTDDCDVD